MYRAKRGVILAGLKGKQAPSVVRLVLVVLLLLLGMVWDYKKQRKEYK